MKIFFKSGRSYIYILIEQISLLNLTGSNFKIMGIIHTEEICPDAHKGFENFREKQHKYCIKIKLKFNRISI